MDVDPEVVRHLFAQGVSASTLSAWFGLPLDEVYGLVGGGEGPVGGVETDLSVAVRDLGLRAVREIHLMLDEASPQVKQRLLTNMFSRMSTLLLKEDTSTDDELREKLTGLFAAFRDEPGSDD